MLPSHIRAINKIILCSTHHLAEEFSVARRRNTAIVTTQESTAAVRSVENDSDTRWLATKTSLILPGVIKVTPSGKTQASAKASKSLTQAEPSVNCFGLSGLLHKFGDVFLNGAISCRFLFISITPPDLPLSRGGISPHCLRRG